MQSPTHVYSIRCSPATAYSLILLIPSILPFPDKWHWAIWAEIFEVHNTVQKVVIKTIPKKNKCKKAKWLSEEAL